MRRLSIIVCLLLAALGIFAAQVVRVRTTYEYLSNDRNESQAQAEAHALEKAKQRALEEKFGVDVSSIVVSMESEQSVNGARTSSEDFFSLGGTIARGEWISTEKEEVLSSTHNGDYWRVKVYVEGTVREKSGTPVDIRYAFVRHAKDRDNCVMYKDGDDLFLRFSSPVDGALCVYLVDAEKNAFCLLPYMSSGKGYQEISANKEYLFFSYETDRSADEITLNTQSEQENNVLYVIFSPNRFTKAKDNAGGKNWRNEDLPRQLRYADFLKWLAKNQTADAEMVVRTEGIVIER